jgi:hypothetical protein
MVVVIIIILIIIIIINLYRKENPLYSWVQIEVNFFNLTLHESCHILGNPTARENRNLAPLLEYGETPHRIATTFRITKHNYRAVASTRGKKNKIFSADNFCISPLVNS